MKTAEEIKLKIKELELEKNKWINEQSNYVWNKKTTENGSLVFGSYQEKESACNKQINLLNWVLNK